MITCPFYLQVKKVNTLGDSAMTFVAEKGDEVCINIFIFNI